MGPFESIIVSGGDMSQATVTSSTVDVTFKEWVGVQGSWTGAPVGTIELDASNDGSVWTSAASTAVSGAGNVFFSMNYATCRYVRALYTKTSGTGTLTVTIQAKGF